MYIRRRNLFSGSSTIEINRCKRQINGRTSCSDFVLNKEKGMMHSIDKDELYMEKNQRERTIK